MVLQLQIKTLPAVGLLLIHSLCSGLLVTAQTARKGELSARQIAQRTFPSVVVLVTEDRSGDKYLGSGFFVSDNVVATNYHVIKGATKIVARRVGQKHVYQVSVLSIDEENDLALLRVEGAIARPLPLARSSRVAVGDVVYVAGNPEGLEGTFSQGIVSALRGKEYVQISAPISHGSSGGPVLNNRGEVIAVAVGVIAEGQNLNFAIPIAQLLPQVVRSRQAGRGLSAMNRPRSLRTGANDGMSSQIDGGQRLNSQEQYAEAAEAFKNALRVDSDDADALLGLAEVYGYLHKYQEAVDFFKDVLRVEPKEAIHTRALLGLAHAYEGLDRYQEAIEVYNDLIRTHPQQEDAYVRLGSDLLAFRLNRYDEGIEVLKSGIATMPKASLLYQSLAGLFEIQDRMSEAEAILNTAVRKCDNPGWFYQLLGTHYCLTLNKCEDAIPYYKLAIQKVDPNPLTVKGELGYIHYSLGIAYLRAGDRSSAVKEYRILKSHYPLFADRLFNEIYK